MMSFITLFTTLESYMLIYISAGCYLSAVNIKKSSIQDNSFSNPDYYPRSLLLHLVNVYGGAVISSFVLHEGPAIPLTNVNMLVIAVLIWYLVIFGHEEVFFKPCDNVFAKLYLECMNDIWSMFKVVTGVRDVSFKFGYSSSSAVLKFLAGLTRGGGVQLLKDLHELKLSVLSERAVLSSCVLTVTSILQLTYEQRAIVFILLTSAFVANKVHLVLSGEGEDENKESMRMKLTRGATWFSFIVLSLLISFAFIGEVTLINTYHMFHV